jgi:hypothetical protein
MPPRFLTIAIIAFWLSMTGWTLYKDVWPHFLPDNPPPFTIDLSDEAQPKGPNHIIWSVSVNGEEGAFHLETWVRYLPKEDLFELNSDMWPVLFAGTGIKEIAKFGMISKVVVSRDGKLVSLNLILTPPEPPKNDKVHIQLIGEIKGGLLIPRILIPDRNIDKTFDPVPIKAHGSVLNPLQPVNRLPNLKPGQRWRMPVVDPVAQAFESMVPLGGGYVRTFDAEVLPELMNLTWKNEEVACQVIQYTGDDASGKTWVRAKDGLVLQQEVSISGKTLVLKRQPTY